MSIGVKSGQRRQILYLRRRGVAIEAALVAHFHNPLARNVDQPTDLAELFNALEEVPSSSVQQVIDFVSEGGEGTAATIRRVRAWILFYRGFGGFHPIGDFAFKSSRGRTFGLNRRAIFPHYLESAGNPLDDDEKWFPPIPRHPAADNQVFESESVVDLLVDPRIFQEMGIFSAAMQIFFTRGRGPRFSVEAERAATAMFEREVVGWKLLRKGFGGNCSAPYLCVYKPGKVSGSEKASIIDTACALVQWPFLLGRDQVLYTSTHIPGHPDNTVAAFVRDRDGAIALIASPNED